MGFFPKTCNLTPISQQLGTGVALVVLEILKGGVLSVHHGYAIPKNDCE